MADDRRRITYEQAQRIEHKLDEILRTLRRFAGTDGTPGGVIRDETRGTFLPGTGWVGPRTLSHDARQALTQLDHDQPT